MRSNAVAAGVLCLGVLLALGPPVPAQDEDPEVAGVPESLHAAERDGRAQIRASLDRQFGAWVKREDGESAFLRLLDEIRGTFDLETTQDHVVLFTRERGQTAVRPDPSLPDPLALTPLGKNAQGCEEFRHERSSIVLVRIPTTAGAYFLGKTEVTNAQFRRFAQRRVYFPGHRSGEFGGMTLDADDQPVVSISGMEVKAYCTWAGLRLPSSGEWEWAAHGGDSATLPWGDAWPPPAQAGNFADAGAVRAGWWGGIPGYEDGFAVTAPVGRYPPNRFGLHDMAGNVWEVSDGYLLGGAWTEFLPSQLLVDCSEPPSLLENRAVGFRVALDVPDK